MDESEAMYMGRVIPKEGFRAFVYGKENRRRIVESWDEFMCHVETGEWFSSPEELQAVEELESYETPNIVHMEFEEVKSNRKKARK